MNAVEEKRASEWVLKHTHVKDKDLRTRLGEGRGGRISYIFTPYGMGTGVTVKCVCGAICDVTDIDSW